MNLSPHPAFEVPECRIASHWRADPTEKWAKVDESFLAPCRGREELTLEGIRCLRAMVEIERPIEILITLEEGMRDASGAWFESGKPLATLTMLFT